MFTVSNQYVWRLFFFKLLYIFRARQRILKEHEQNTQAVNNQLQMPPPPPPRTKFLISFTLIFQSAAENFKGTWTEHTSRQQPTSDVKTQTTKSVSYFSVLNFFPKFMQSKILRIHQALSSYMVLLGQQRTTNLGNLYFRRSVSLEWIHIIPPVHVHCNF